MDKEDLRKRNCRESRWKGRKENRRRCRGKWIRGFSDGWKEDYRNGGCR